MRVMIMMIRTSDSDVVGYSVKDGFEDNGSYKKNTNKCNWIKQQTEERQQ